MNEISRRAFLAGCGGICVWACLGDVGRLLPEAAASRAKSVDRIHVFKGDAPDSRWKWSHEAFSYEKLPDKKVVCTICPNFCELSPGDRSICRSRVNMDGTL
jgi:pyruvate formate lyase activating enzyme